jgi:hypothetical protein
MEVEGIFVLLLDIGQLSPAKAEIFIKNLEEKSDFNKLEKKCSGWKLMILPRRYCSTELLKIKLTSRGVIVFYIDVGTLSPFSAEKYLKAFKNKYEWLADLPQCSCMVPIRQESSYVEYFNLEDENVTQENKRTKEEG